MRTLIGVAALVSGVAAYAYAQAPDRCGDERWTRFSTSFRQGGTTFEGDPTLRNVSFCLRGALVKADEATVVSTDGGRTYSLTGNVTLTMPAR